MQTLLCEKNEKMFKNRINNFGLETFVEEETFCGYSKCSVAETL